MKRILTIIFSICILLATGITRGVYAQNTQVTAPILETITPTPVEYVLPYPGVLPDHPMYFLKRIRDAILEMVIIEPIRKAEFYILQGDKRIQMGMMLIEQQKFPLAETTISKGEKYMEKAVTGLLTYKTNGGVIPTYVVNHLEKALLKHKEIIESLLSKVSEPQKTGLASSLELNVATQQRLKTLMDQSK